MADYVVNTSKFMLLLFLMAVVFFGVGYYVQKTTIHATTAVSSNLQAKPLSVQEILQDTALTDPAQEFVGLSTSLLFAHTVSGQVVNVSPTDFRLRVNRTISGFPKSPATAYFLLVGKTSSLTTSQALSVGDLATVTVLFDVQANTSLGSIVIIDKSGARAQVAATNR